MIAATFSGIFVDHMIGLPVIFQIAASRPLQVYMLFKPS